MTSCPICLSVDGFASVNNGTWGPNNMRHDCALCGTFGTTWEARDDYLGEERAKTTAYVRAALSHWVRRHQAVRNRDGIPLVTSDLIEATLKGEITLPSPGQQATNIIRFVGDSTRDTGLPLRDIPASFHAVIGSITRRFAFDAAKEMKSDGLMDFTVISADTAFDAIQVRLTLKGWANYDAEAAGKTASAYGFLALKFGDDTLDTFIRLHAKPAAETLGFRLEDMRDRARAGVIDDLMRIDIRDAAFVIADLSHDNPGAYWEAGYAEGLGKPVLYICEKSKFEEFKTHFDTNHSTTVLWDANEPEAFKEQFIATLRRSLVL